MGHFNISCELQKLNVEKSVENVDNFLRAFYGEMTHGKTPFRRDGFAKETNGQTCPQREFGRFVLQNGMFRCARF